MAESQEEKLLNKRWVRAVIALLFLVVAYGFASLAIDSGSLLEYAATIIFFVQAIMHAVHAIRNR